MKNHSIQMKGGPFDGQWILTSVLPGQRTLTFKVGKWRGCYSRKPSTSVMVWVSEVSK